MSLDSAPTVVCDASTQDLANAETQVLPGSAEQLETPCQPSIPQVPDEAKPVEAKAPEAQVPKLSPQLVATAIKNFADHFGGDAGKVTEEMVAGSNEGLHYWATFKVDVSARGPGAQAMNRAFKQNPDLKASYAILTDSLKLQFRRAWICEKSFDFVRTSRTTVNKFLKRRDEFGSFKTQLQITILLGGVDQPQAVAQAQCYVDMCLQPSLKALLGVATFGDILC